MDWKIEIFAVTEKELKKMAKYIDADKLLRKIARMVDCCEKNQLVYESATLFQVCDAIYDCPSADVEEVKQGYWKRDFCSVCGKLNPTNYLDECALEYKAFYLPRCPYCGAYMKKE